MGKSCPLQSGQSLPQPACEPVFVTITPSSKTVNTPSAVMTESQRVIRCVILKEAPAWGFALWIIAFFVEAPFTLLELFTVRPFCPLFGVFPLLPLLPPFPLIARRGAVVVAMDGLPLALCADFWGVEFLRVALCMASAYLIRYPA